MADYSTFLKKMKRQIVSHTKKISFGMKRPEQKFAADLCYGMLSSGSCLLTDIASTLQEPNKKVNTVERLSRHLERGVPDVAQKNYQSLLRNMVPEDEVTVHIDNSDVVKPCGRVLRDWVQCGMAPKAPGASVFLRRDFM